MRSVWILIKYYCCCVLLGLIFGFNQYAFDVSIPIYITSAITNLILWGLIYSALKESEATYGINQLAIVAAGVTIPNAVVLYLYPGFLGIPVSGSTVAALISLVLGSIVVWCLFLMSKSMVLSAPLNDDYDN